MGVNLELRKGQKKLTYIVATEDADNLARAVKLHKETLVQILQKDILSTDATHLPGVGAIMKVVERVPSSVPAEPAAFWMIARKIGSRGLCGFGSCERRWRARCCRRAGGAGNATAVSSSSRRRAPRLNSAGPLAHRPPPRRCLSRAVGRRFFNTTTSFVHCIRPCAQANS